MKKISIIIGIIIGLLIIPINVFARGSITPSTKNLTITKGSSGVFTITASNAAGRVDISSSNSSVASVNKFSDFLDNSSTTITVTGVSSGNATITVKLSDAATFDTEEELTGSYSINVTVNEPQTNNTEIEQNNTSNNNTQSNTNIDNSNTNNNTNANTNTDDETESDLSDNNILEELSIEGYELVKKENNVYELTVTNNITEINIVAKAEDSEAYIEGAGKKELEIGLNKFEIIVTAESGKERTYTINVTRKDGYYINDIVDIIDDIESKTIDVTIEKNSKITKEILEIIKETKKIINFNYYNEEEKLIYSWVINGEEIKDILEINTSVFFSSEYKEKIDILSNYANGMYIDFEYNGNFPENTKIKLYVGDKFEDDKLVNIYHYNKEDNILENIKEEVIVKDGYIEFNIAQGSTYFITMSNIHQEEIKESTSKEINIYMIIAIIEAIIIIGLIVFYIIKIKSSTKLRYF